jgi:cytochrome c oxidase subunit 2
MDRFWRLPQNISSYGGEIDSMFHIIAWITIIVFFAVEILLVWFLIRYRARAGQKARYTHGNNRMEVAWTAGTALIVLVLGVMSRGLWLDIKDPTRFPDSELELIVTAKQFEWNVTYPGADGVIETADDFTVRNQLRVPVNTNVRFTLRSEDVIHSFYVPELRLKQDAVPGMSIPAWFEATATGQYVLGCAELCGVGHYSMDASFYVHTAEEWAQWNAQQQTAAAGAAGPTLAAGQSTEPDSQDSADSPEPAAAATSN